MSLSSYPERRDLYRESASEAVDIIIENMAEPAEKDDGIDLEPHRASLIQCLIEARECYLVEYADWLARSTDEGGPFRPDRDEFLNPGGASPHDYREFREPPGTRRRHWDELHAKRPSPTGRRSPNNGTFRGLPNTGPPLGKPMLAWIFHRLYRWWRGAMPDTPFGMNLDGIEGVDDTATERFSNLNVPARLFVLFAFEVDQRFTISHCARVASEERRFLNVAQDPSKARSRAAAAKTKAAQQKVRRQRNKRSAE